MYSNIGGKDDGFELGPEEKEKIVELYGEPNGKVRHCRKAYRMLLTILSHGIVLILSVLFVEH